MSTIFWHCQLHLWPTSTPNMLMPGNNYHYINNNFRLSLFYIQMPITTVFCLFMKYTDIFNFTLTTYIWSITETKCIMAFQLYSYNLYLKHCVHRWHLPLQFILLVWKTQNVLWQPLTIFIVLQRQNVLCHFLLYPDNLK